MRRSAGICSAAIVALCLVAGPAHAQYFSNHDGYTENGQYRVQVEISPYLWIPATSGTYSFGHSAFADKFSGDFGSAMPSLSTLATSLHFSFMGDGIMRYGPYSTELDLQYVSAFGSKTFSLAPNGNENRLHVNASYVRVAPGFGYQIYRGDIFSIPTSVDARAGFSYFEHWENFTGESNLVGRTNTSGNFIQPWLGTRIDFIPAPRWRLELAALVQGMGVDNGSWGWGASAMASYAVTSWMDVDAGYSALNTERNNPAGTPGPKRALELTAYGPVFGVTLRFGCAPPPPPPVAVAPVAAPAPAAAQTYLVFFDWDKADLSPRAMQIIAQAAADSRTQAVTRINVNGYTDTSGNAAYNQRLSVRRAQAVQARLIADGVPPAEIAIKGFGDTHLLVPTGPDVREPQNRRVEIIMH